MRSVFFFKKKVTNITNKEVEHHQPSTRRFHTGNDLIGLVHDGANLGIAVTSHGAVVDVGRSNNGKRIIDDQVLGVHVNGMGRVDAASCVVAARSMSENQLIDQLSKYIRTNYYRAHETINETGRRQWLVRVLLVFCVPGSSTRLAGKVKRM